MISGVAVWENLPHMSDELQEERSLSHGESEARLAVVSRRSSRAVDGAGTGRDATRLGAVGPKDLPQRLQT